MKRARVFEALASRRRHFDGLSADEQRARKRPGSLSGRKQHAIRKKSK